MLSVSFALRRRVVPSLPRHVVACPAIWVQTNQHQHRSLLASARSQTRRNEDKPAAGPPSRRKEFQQIPVNPKILQHILDQQVCLPVRQARRRRFDRLTADANNKISNKSPGPPPPPFDTQQKIRKRNQIKITDKNIAEKLKWINPKGIPTVALCGRSNVGKSTLLNALLYGNRTTPKKQNSIERRGYKVIPMPKGAKAITSPTPGETKEITFYELSAAESAKDSATLDIDSDKKDVKQPTSTDKNPSESSLWLADLPGYGFAHASPELVRDYQQLMVTYLCHPNQRPRRLLLLLDARHGMKQTDRLFLQNLQQQLLAEINNKNNKTTLPAIQIVLTKCDLVNAEDLARRVVQARNDLDDVFHRQPSRLPVLVTSATRQNGILAIQKELAGLVTTR